MERRKLSDSFNAAIEGIIYTIKSQKNMRIHFLMGMLVILLSVFFNLGKIETILLTLTVALVLIAEMFNTAIEKILDIVTPEFHPLARITKDIAAGCVLIAAMSSVTVGYLIFSKILTNFSLDSLLSKVEHSSWHITFVSLIGVIFLVILGKALFKKGKPLRGGMPSGHAAVAFSMWTVIVLLAKNELIFILSLIMAIIIAQSRLKDAIHTKWEIITGGILGILTTLLCFQIFK